jgi:hypothetical protein
LITVGANIESWEACQKVLRAFLSTNESHLLLFNQERDLGRSPQLSVSDLSSVDLIQFYKLRVLKKGELGIREIHFLFANFISRLMSSRSLNRLIAGLTIRLPGEIYKRFTLVKQRRDSINAALMSVSELGIVIPHFIEPCESTLIVSRKFALAILELGSNGQMTLFRICFALSRSSNFVSIRVRGISPGSKRKNPIFF